MQELTITIDQAGKIEMLARDEFAELYEQGRVTKTRASHVAPVNFALRQAFWILRWATGEQGPVSDWTRRWRCRWQVQIVNGPYLGEYAERVEAIAAEVDWIERNRMGA
jgi:hypothetical protein